LEPRWSGQLYGWRYLARRVDGSGTPGPWLDSELPLQGVQITDVVSGPPQLTGTITPVHARLLMPDGMPLLTENDTEVAAEKDGQIVACGHLVRNAAQGHVNEIEVNGFTGYAKDMGFLGDPILGPDRPKDFVDTDPLDVVRYLWDHVQNVGPRSNIGLVVDPDTRTPVTVGRAPEHVIEGTPAVEQTTPEPYRLATWQTDDIGGEIDALAASTPFDYHERHQWNDDRSEILHFLDFGFPRLGQRRSITFTVGGNVQEIPKVERDGTQTANHVRVLGAGEGSAMIRADARLDDGRLRKMITITDDSITDPEMARTRARTEVAMRAQATRISSFVVRNTGETQLGAWHVGDEVRLVSREGWLHVDQWVRILSQTITPEDPALATCTVLRADRFAV
jgi:hypothetical protein